MSGLAPKLRFPSFKDNWQVAALKKLAKIYDGTHQTPNYVENGVPFYSVEHLTSDNFTNTKFITEEVYQNELKRVSIEKYDVLMTRIGDIGTSKVIDWDVRASFYVSLALFKFDKDKSISSFMHYLISSDAVQKELYKRTIHVAFPKKINLGEIGECFGYIPSLPEQQKIADFLSSIDAKIDAVKRKLDAFERYKKGLMQQIFNQKIRFKQEDGTDFPEWEEKRLGDLADIIGGGTPETHVDEYWHGSIHWFTPSEITLKYLGNSKRTISPLGLKNSSAKLLPVGTLLLSSRATVGEVGIATQVCATNQGFQSLIVKSTHSNEFIYYWIKQNKNEFLLRSAGSTFLEVGKTEIAKIPVNIPSLPEQHKIADFLSSVDAKIDAIKAQVEKLEAFKKGLLQQMFV